MKLFALIACVSIYTSTSGAEDHESSPWRCDGSPFPMRPPPRRPPSLGRPHVAKVDQQPFVPYKILYLIDNEIAAEEYEKLKMATEYANERFSKLIKARKLVDVRYQNLDPNCEEQCRDMPFPADFVLPCPVVLQSEPTAEIKQLNEADYTLVVRVLVRYQGIVANETLHCREESIAYAQSCQLADAEVDHAPHHGFFVFCHKPSTKSDSALRILVMHETLHILMPYSLSGTGATHSCDYDDCKDITWKEVKREAMNEHGHPVEITSGMAIAPLIREAAKDHFGCDTAEGAELNLIITDKTTMDANINHGHWSQHLFSDEILAPLEGAGRLSNLTLSALASHDKWYQVDRSQAEPLVYSMPSKEFACDVAHKSCFDILNGVQRGNEVKLMHPYCDHRKGADRILASHCSHDNQRQLICVNHLGDTGCSFLVDADDTYNTCANATSTIDGALASHSGASIGPGTICVTTTDFPPWTEHQTNALCVRHECRADALILKFKPNNDDDPDCHISCDKNQSNRLLTVTWCSTTTHRVTIICPDYEQVCKKEPTTRASTSARVVTPVREALSITSAPGTVPTTVPSSSIQTSVSQTSSTSSVTAPLVMQIVCISTILVHLGTSL